MPHTNMPKVVKYPKEIPDPQDEDDHDQAVQDRFDLSLHRDKPVYEPQHKPDSNNCDDDGGKRHSVFSSNFSYSIRAPVVGKYKTIDSLGAAVIQEEKSDSSLHSYSSKAAEK